MISTRLRESFLTEIDLLIKKGRYLDRSHFLDFAVKEKLAQLQTRGANKGL